MSVDARNEVNDETDIVVGPREQLFHLLAEASEIEHTLMCSYLYAAFSLKNGNEPDLLPEEGVAIAEWRKTIMSVALDEMVHLVLVSNLSVAVGGRPHFARPNFPVESGYFPSGVVVKLTPFSTETLDHFIFLERPQGHQIPDGQGFEPAKEYRREQPYSGLMPSVQDYDTVGRLYEALRVNLIASARRLGETALFSHHAGAQLDRASIDLDGVARITDLESALAALATIVEQGEGSERDRDDSHYRKFSRIQRAYSGLLERNPRFAPAWPAAESPVMRRPPSPEGKVFVDEPLAAYVLDFDNAVYALLLRCLVQSFETTAKGRERFVSAAISLMHVLGKVSHALVKLPASSQRQDVNAGMSFTMLRNVSPMHSSTQLIAERLQELGHAARRIAKLVPELSALPRELTAISAAFEPEGDA